MPEQTTRLYVISGPDIGQSFELSAGAVYVGRGSDNNIQIKDRFVSRKHLRITTKDHKHFLEDMESKNGTFVDGTLIRPGKEVELKEGIPVVLGMSVICLGEGCSEDILELLDSLQLPESEDKEDLDSPLPDRPMTSQRNMELLRKVSQVFSESMDVEEILGKILGHIFDYFTRVDRGAVILVDPETGKVSKAVCKVKESVTGGVERYSQAVVDRVLEEGRGIVIPNVEEKADLPGTLKGLKVRSVMCVPLASPEGVRGLLYADSIERPNGFRKDDLSLFKALTIPVKNVIENAVLYARKRKA